MFGHVRVSRRQQKVISFRTVKTFDRNQTAFFNFVFSFVNLGISMYVYTHTYVE